MKFARSFFIFSYGLFTIAAQTLLFREFLTTFEGNDISVGLFFASWFFWVGLGAIVVYRLKAHTQFLVDKIEFLLLAYLPAFVLQLYFIIYAREIASIEHFTLLSIRTILFLSIIANAPVSIITGIFFPTACRWIQQQDRLAVSRVYILEAAGSLLGGLASTILLTLGVSFVRISLLLFILVSFASALVHLTKTASSSDEAPSGIIKFAVRTFFIAILLFLLLALFSSTDNYLNRKIQLTKWSRLLPKDSFRGSFQTPQAEYLYGTYRSQWLSARDGFIVEAVPEQSETALAAAVALSQNPNAKKILVIGSGISLCSQFLKLPQTESVCWAYYDNQYVKKTIGLLPADYKISDPRFSPLSGDIRSFLAAGKNSFDIIILNLPDATSSVLNRYFTVQFYQLVKNSLKPDGLLTVRVSGGENIMGTELVNLGASVRKTLLSVFSHFTLTPGEQSYFLASNNELISDQPALLKDRFKVIVGADKILSPDALLSVYLPDRAEKAVAAYENADLPPSLLINTDQRPLTHLYSLLLTAKQSGTPVTRFIKLLTLASLPVFLVPVFIIIVMRFIYLVRIRLTSNKSNETKQQLASAPPSFDSSFLAFTAGLSGIAVVIILMYIYQTRFGSLYLHIGLISSLFMLGLAAGAALIKFLIAKKQHLKPRFFLITVAVLHILILMAVASDTLFIENLSANWAVPAHFIFAIAFLLSGLCTGCYFPIAAKQLADAGFETGSSGSKLEMSDHFGACVGGILTSLLLVPILGTKMSLIFLMIIIAANLPAALIGILNAGKTASMVEAAPLRKKFALTLFAIGVSVILFSNLLAYANKKVKPEVTRAAADVLGQNLKIKKLSFPSGKTTVSYCSVYDNNEKPAGYIFSSEQFAPEVRGFGGKINLDIFVDTAGNLLDFEIVSSNETPEYLQRVISRKDLFKGKPLLAQQPFSAVDSVTGATISYNAIASALQLATVRFFSQVINKTPPPDIKNYFHRYIPDKTAIYLIIALLSSFIVIYFGGYRTRLAVLIFNLLIAGFFFNAQFSTVHITNLLSFSLPSAGFTGVFLLTVGVPLLVIIIGNVYCGYLCPFGALQELISYIIPDKFKPLPAPQTVRKAVFTRYVLLFIFITAFFLSGKPSVLIADPLVKIFSGMLDSVLIFTALIALLGSLFYTRFWCLYLCPAGAFLCLLNRISLLKRLLPAKRFARCEFAILPANIDDCIMCDRCRYNQVAKAIPYGTIATAGKSAKQPAAVLFVTAVSASAIFISAITINGFLKAVPKSYTKPPAAITSTAQPQEDADIQRIRKMIETKKLSDKEALFYEKVE